MGIVGGLDVGLACGRWEVGEEVGDRIDDGSRMDQPEEVEVGRRASSLLFLSGI